MKVSKNWLKQLVDLKTPIDEAIRLIPLRTIGIKEELESYIELDMKGYNRSDLLSMRGVAYETAAITGSDVTFGEPEESDFEWHKKELPEVKVEIKEKELAPFYCIAKIEGLKAEKSSPEWIKKLEESGMRPVNNIADVTNLVMLEYGQPLHAFDAATVKDEEIIVRTALEGETLITLDGKKRGLRKTDLLITDPEKTLGLAGVMGGKNSEISDSTSTILLEAAIFDPAVLRNTALRLGLTSEASKRFEHGLTKKRALQAFNAAINMYRQLGGKLTSLVICGNWEDAVQKISLNHNKINSLIGVDIDAEAVESSLSRLYFTLERIGEGEWLVTPPYWRLDINIEEDLIEEVARMYGYEKLPAKPLTGEVPATFDQQLFHKIYDIKSELVQTGLTEVQTYSFYQSDVLDNLEFNRNKLVKIVNPMSRETEYLRDELWPNLLRVAAENLKYRDDLAIFEIGKTYQPQKGSLPLEKYKLAMALSSNITLGVQELYMIFLKLAQAFKLDFKPVDKEKGEREVKLFHPVRLVAIEQQGKEIGFIGEIHPRITHKFGTDKRIAVLELKIN